MTNYEKMIQLVKSDASKDQIKAWAYMNRVTVCMLPYEAEEMKPMLKSVDAFMNTKDYQIGLDEDEVWDKFLDAEYVN